MSVIIWIKEDEILSQKKIGENLVYFSRTWRRENIKGTLKIKGIFKSSYPVTENMVGNLTNIGNKWRRNFDKKGYQLCFRLIVSTLIKPENRCQDRGERINIYVAFGIIHMKIIIKDIMVDDVPSEESLTCKIEFKILKVGVFLNDDRVQFVCHDQGY